MGVTGNAALISYSVSLFWGLGCDIFWGFFSLIVLLPVLGCGRWIRYHCLGCSPVPLVHHAALPSLPPSGPSGKQWTEGMYGQGGQVFIFQKNPHTNQVLTSQAPSRSIEASVIRYRFPAAHWQWKCVLALVGYLFSSQCTVIVGWKHVCQYLNVTLSTVIMRLFWD